MSSESNSVTRTSDKNFWIPLESNPDVINAMIARLGVDKTFQFGDVWGLDDELLAMVAQPVKAVVFLFPLTDKYESCRRGELAKNSRRVSSNVWFMRQTIGNACGTMAIIHSLANNQRDIPIGGYLGEFLDRVKDMTPAERAEALESDPFIASAHLVSASAGQTAAPAPEADINLHFIAFVSVDGDLYELDGRQEAPFNHGPSTDLLKDAALVIKQRIESFEGESQEFTVLSLGVNPELL
ncbi:Ubiquitin carboxyl-terminal hydrolase isozyme L3 [Dipsacomyces acuminosporus]|nr:Ubiquitin carboxyl-terminal hydrolase isozyme L3 [Dipsacomyces acuminosporus]